MSLLVPITFAITLFSMIYLICVCPICLLNIFLSFQLFVFSALWSPQPIELPSFLVSKLFGPPKMSLVLLPPVVDFKDREYDVTNIKRPLAANTTANREKSSGKSVQKKLKCSVEAENRMGQI